MANNRLWNVLAFTNVAAGGSVALPHLLQNNSDAKIPDYGWINNAVFTATADDTNVTVTNNSGAIATVQVLVCSIHSLIRVFGGTSVPNLIPQPYWIIGSGSSATVVGPQVQRYTAVGGESDFNVVLTTPRPNDSYSVFPTQAGMASVVGIDCPDTLAGDRTALQFRVRTTAALTAGDIIDFLITARP